MQPPTPTNTIPSKAKKPGGNKFLFILSWAFSVLLLLAGLGALTSKELFAGIMTIITGLVFLPPLCTKLNLNRWVKTGAVVVWFVVLAITQQSKSDSTTASVKADEKPASMATRGIGKSLDDFENAVPAFDQNITIGKKLSDGTQLYNSETEVMGLKLFVTFYGPKENLSRVKAEIRTREISPNTILGFLGFFSKIVCVARNLNDDKDCISDVADWLKDAVGEMSSSKKFDDLTVKMGKDKTDDGYLFHITIIP